MKVLAEKCSVYQYIHQQMAFEYQQLHDRLTLAALLLAPLPGFMSALSLNYTNRKLPQCFTSPEYMRFLRRRCVYVCIKNAEPEKEHPRTP